MNRTISLGAIKAELDKIPESLANMDTVSHTDLEDLCRNLYSSLDSVYSRMNEVYSRIYDSEETMYQMLQNHVKSALHLPAVTSVEQLERIIDKLGLSKEFNVIKRNVYSSNGAVEKVSWEVSNR